MTHPAERVLAGLRWHAVAQTVLWLALAAISVHLAQVVPLRLDLTRDGRYTLSDAAREAVDALERPLVVRVFWTDPLDPPYHAHRAALLDLLGELDAAAGGKLLVSAVDPGADPALRAEADALGVHPIPYQFRSRDRSEVRTVYMGAALVYGERRVAIDVLPSVGRMEVDLVRAIRSLTVEPDDRTSVGWWLGHGEPDPSTAAADSPLRTLAERLAARGPFRTVGEVDAPIPEDIDVLVIAAPRRAVPGAELVALDQFVMRGGRVLALLSSFQPDFERGAPVPVDHGLYAWLGSLGIRANRDLLIDRLHTGVLAVPLGPPGARKWVRTNHPLALVTTKLDRTLPAVRALPELVLPFASSLAVADPLLPGIEAETWATTEPEAGALKGLVTLDPGALGATLSSEVAGPHPVVVAVSGRFPSMFVERPLPPRTDPHAAPFDAASLLRESEPTRIVAVGSGDAVANNLDLVTNAVDWLAEDPVLISLRSRADSEPGLAAPSRARAAQIRTALVGAPLAALALIAALVARRGGR